MEEAAIQEGAPTIIPGAARRVSPSGFGRRVYPIRIVGNVACILIGWLYVSNFGTLRAWYLFLLALALTYPHVSRYLIARLEAHRAIELGSILVDAFMLGSTVYVAGFSPVPALALLTVAFSNGMALGGVSLMSASAVSAGIGIAIPTLLYGLNYEPRQQLHMNLTSALYLLVHFNLFAWVAYRRAVLLQKSRDEIRHQKLAAEIEKKRSDSLLLAILPGPVASEFRLRGTVEPRLHEDATLLVADVHDFRNVSREVEPDVLLSELNHCFKAFDQIVARHRLEPLKTVGDAYLAGGGITASSDTHARDAVRSALEMRDFVRRLNDSRRAAGRPAFDFRFAVHRGAIVSGVVETRKLSFDVWGDALDVVMQVEHAAGPGEVAVSEAVLSRIADEVSSRRVGTVRTKSGDDVQVYAVEARSNGIG